LSTHSITTVTIISLIESTDIILYLSILMVKINPRENPTHAYHQIVGIQPIHVLISSSTCSTYLLVGGPLEGQGTLRFEKWRLFASFGAYGGKETIGALRIWKVPWKRFYPCFTFVLLDYGLCPPFVF